MKSANSTLLFTELANDESANIKGGQDEPEICSYIRDEIATQGPTVPLLLALVDNQCFGEPLT